MEQVNSDTPVERPQLCVLKVTLDGVTPSIWRRLVCPIDVSLELLNVVLQEAFGWSGEHSYEFKVGDKQFLSENEGGDVKVHGVGFSTEDTTLESLGLKAGGKLSYRYHFADNWQHTILIEEIRVPLVLEPEFGCRGGERAAAIEDCGGAPQFQEILEAIKDKKHPQREHLYEVYDLDAYDSSQFDPAEVNERLQIELLLDDRRRELVYKLADAEESDEVDEVDGDLPDQDERIELLLSVTLTNQMMADEPKEVLGTLGKLIALGVTEGDALSQVFDVFSEEFFESHTNNRPFDLVQYAKKLSALPSQV